MGYFLIGVISWPLLEYLLHRYSGHIYRLPAAFSNEHQTHHAVKDYFAPVWKKLLVSIVIMSIMTFVLGAFSNYLSAFIFIGGFIFMYLYYEWLHYAFHRYPPKTERGLRLRKHHFAHHYMSPRKNFGVSSTFLDVLFNTYFKCEKVRIPKKYQMNWLVDNDGEVLRQYQDHFMLI